MKSYKDYFKYLNTAIIGFCLGFAFAALITSPLNYQITSVKPEVYKTIMLLKFVIVYIAGFIQGLFMNKLFKKTYSFSKNQYFIIITIYFLVTLLIAYFYFPFDLLK